MSGKGMIRLNDTAYCGTGETMKHILFLSFFLLLPGGLPGYAQTATAPQVICPDKVAGMTPLKTTDGALCTYIRENRALHLIALEPGQPDLETYDTELRTELNLASRGNATPFCNKAMKKRGLKAQCIVSYNPGISSVTTEWRIGDQRVQTRLVIEKDSGVNQDDLFWSILATRILIEKITAE